MSFLTLRKWFLCGSNARPVASCCSNPVKDSVCYFSSEDHFIIVESYQISILACYPILWNLECDWQGLWTTQQGQAASKWQGQGQGEPWTKLEKRSSHTHSGLIQSFIQPSGGIPWPPLKAPLLETTCQNHFDLYALSLVSQVCVMIFPSQ